MTSPKHIPAEEQILLGYENEENGGPVSLPLIFSTDSTAIIGRKGSGKSTLARKLTEGLIEHDLHPVIIDPLDVWWGLRAAADGRGAGLDVVIFGGSHADLPITEQSATYIADLVVDQRISAILVLDEMKQAGQRRFVQKFMERVFERKRPQEMRTPLHVVVDESDTFIPQNPMTPEAIGSLSEVDRAIRHGRSRGIGTTVISQRPAKVNKDVLTQCELLIALQVTGPQDRKALREWTDAKATEDQAKHFWGSLASMKRGQAWVWSPSLLECFTMVNVELPWTYDSSFTPSINSKPRPAAKLKDLDLASIKTAMAATIEQAKANDPKILKERIRALEAEQAKLLRSKNVTVTTPVDMNKVKAEIDRAVAKALKDRDNQWRITFAGCNKMLLAAIKDTFGACPNPGDVPEIALPAAVQRVVDMNMVLGPGSNPRPNDQEVINRITKGLLDAAAKSRVQHNGDTDFATSTAMIKGQVRSFNGTDTAISAPHRKILTVLAQHSEHHNSEGMPQERCAIRAGYSYSGGFRNYLSELRGHGFIMGGPGSVYITVDGLKALGEYEHLPTGPGLLGWWKQRVSSPEAKILNVLDNHPDGLSGADLARTSGYEYSGGFRNYLSSLRTKGLIVGKGGELIKLHEDLT